MSTPLNYLLVRKIFTLSAKIGNAQFFDYLTLSLIKIRRDRMIGMIHASMLVLIARDRETVPRQKQIVDN